MNFSESETIFLNKLITSGKLTKLNISDYSFDHYIFPQIWTTSNGGFETQNIVGQLNLVQYTHVVKADFKLNDNSIKSYYGVLFDECLSYYVEEPNDRFNHDLHEFKLKCKGNAIQKYLAKC